MPIINSMAELRYISQAQESFVRLSRSGSQLTTSTTKAHFWQRSQKAMEKSESIAAAERVRDSVCAHCGKAMGTILFNRYIGEKSLKGARFTSTNLAHLLDAATRANVAYLGQKLSDFAVGDRLRPEIRKELRLFGMDEEDFVSVVQQAFRTVEDDFFSDEELTQAATRLSEIHQKLLKMQKLLAEVQSVLPSGGKELSHLQACVNGLIGEVMNKADMLIAQSEKTPFSNKNVRTAFQQMYAAYEMVIQQQIGRLTQAQVDAQPEQAARLSSQVADLKVLLASVQANKADPPSLRGVSDVHRASKEVMEELKELPKNLGKELVKILPDRSSGQLSEAIKRAHVDVLNKQPWNIIQEDVQYPGHAGKVTARSTITPARHIGLIGQSMAQDNLQGVSCGDRGQAKHAVNLASTEISVGGTTLFRGIRHGVNSAYTLSNPKERIQANNTRAREIFAAALQSSPELLQRAQASKPGDIIDLPMLSTSLLTPDAFRPLYDSGGAERNHLRDQYNAWQDACQGGLCQITVSTASGNKTVTVRPTVVAFNFGVNVGAQGVMQGLLGGWSVSSRYNKAAMAQLFGMSPNWQGGMVAQYLARPDVSAQNKQMVAELRSQIIELWESKDFRKRGEDPYRLPARLAMLGHLMGMMPLFNCKSGKDRTGQMDVACKTLALQMYERGGKVPPLDEPRTSVDEHIFHQVAINGGNLEMQRMNTGLAGFKTGGVEGLDKLFSEGALEMHRGLSRYVEV